MNRQAQKVVPMPGDDAARRERRLLAKWAEIDRLEAQLKALRAAVAPLHGEVSRDYGYPFNVSRDALSLAMKARK